VCTFALRGPSTGRAVASANFCSGHSPTQH
jgi:hypothetical protein